MCQNDVKCFSKHLMNYAPGIIRCKSDMMIPDDMDLFQTALFWRIHKRQHDDIVQGYQISSVSSEKYCEYSNAIFLQPIYFLHYQNTYSKSHMIRYIFDNTSVDTFVQFVDY